MRSSEPVSRRGTHTNKSSTPPLKKKNSNQPPKHKVLQSLSKMRPKTPYVLQGLYYFMRHKSLIKTMVCPIVWSLVFAIAAFCILLPVAFIPQAIALSGVMSPWLGVPLALLFALLEMLVIIMIFAAVALMPITDKLFDQVLILRGHAALVEADNGMACCGCCSIVSVLSLTLSICSLPLNLIPFVGTVLWLFLNGRLYTWDKHSHYHYELKQRNFWKQRKFVKEHWISYHIFGMQAMALELIPFANVFFVFTNTVGAALWAADWEDQLLANQAESTKEREGSQSHPTEETSLPLAKAEPYGGA